MMMVMPKVVAAGTGCHATLCVCRGQRKKGMWMTGCVSVSVANPHTTGTRLHFHLQCTCLAIGRRKEQVASRCLVPCLPPRGLTMRPVCVG